MRVAAAVARLRPTLLLTPLRLVHPPLPQLPALLSTAVLVSMKARRSLRFPQALPTWPLLRLLHMRRQGFRPWLPSLLL